MQCPSCQTQLSATAKFCGVCGTTIDNASPGAFSRVAAAAAAASAPAKQYQYTQPINTGGMSPVVVAPNLEKKYKTLRTIAVLLKILAFLSGGIACIIALISLGTALSASSRSGPFNFGPDPMVIGVLWAGGVIMYGAIIFAFLFGLAEIIHLFMDIEENTRGMHQQLLAQTNSGLR